MMLEISQESLEKFLQEVCDLHALVSNFLKYYEDLKEKVCGKNLDDLPEDIRNIFLAGINEYGQYLPRSYALFIKDFLGLYIEDKKDLEGYVASKIINSSSKYNVKISVKESMFYNFIHDLKEILDIIINASKRKKIIPKSCLDDKKYQNKIEPNNLETIIAELLSKAFNLCAGINNFTTSIWVIRKVDKSYFDALCEKYYKGNVDYDVLEKLGFKKEMLLGIELMGFPDYFWHSKIINNKNNGSLLLIKGAIIPKIRNYISSKDFQFLLPETLGGAICSLNDLIWSYSYLLNKELTGSISEGVYLSLMEWFDGSRNPEKEYLSKAWASLKNSGWITKNKNKLSYLSYLPYENICSDWQVLIEKSGKLSEWHTELNSKRTNLYSYAWFVSIWYKNGITEKYYYQWALNGPSKEEKSIPKIPVICLINDLLPAISLGTMDVADITLTESISEDLRSYDGAFFVIGRGYRFLHVDI